MDETRAAILIVDDEEMIRNILCRKLQAEGYYCVTAADGKDALNKVFMQDFDIVLLDIKMPGVSGIELLPKILVDHPDTGVVMVTAATDVDIAVKAMKLGAYDYVAKPFDMQDLVIRIEKALERRKLLLENREYHLRLEDKLKEQAVQIEEYYRKAIEGLALEQIALEKSEPVRKGQQGGVAFGLMEVDKSSETSSSVREFAKRVSQLFATTNPYSPSGKNYAKSAGTDEMPEESLD